MIELKQYRDLWLREKMDEVIGFYPREFYCLDNFSSFKLNTKDIYTRQVKKHIKQQNLLEVLLK